LATVETPIARTSGAHPAPGDGHAHVHHHPRLAHHFDSMEQQRESASLGMWAFLVQEIMFFGGMFTAYVVYRSMYFKEFAQASEILDVTLGGINTAVLICSSLTMALAVYYAQQGNRKLITYFLLATIGLGGVFLGIKTVEYRHKFEEHVFPAGDFRWPPVHEGAALQEGHTSTVTTAHSSSEQANVQAGEGASHRMVGMDQAFGGHVRIFFWLYFAMTGFHALHMIIGMGLMFVLAWQAWHGKFSKEYHSYIELTGLYWHFVDIVWIFLFPLLYLVDRHL
jgi:cytochrome c oxidase subunit 3